MLCMKIDLLTVEKLQPSKEFIKFIKHRCSELKNLRNNGNKKATKLDFSGPNAS